MKNEKNSKKYFKKVEKPKWRTKLRNRMRSYRLITARHRTEILAKYKEKRANKLLKEKYETIRGTKFSLTYESNDFLNQDDLTVFFNKIYPVKELYINFHLGITHVAVWFKRQLNRTHDTAFNYVQNGICYRPTIDIIKGKDKSVWKKVTDTFRKEDKKETWDARDVKRRMNNKTYQAGKTKKKHNEEKQVKKLEKERKKELTKERRRKLNCERMRKCRKRLLEQKNEQIKNENQQLKNQAIAPSDNSLQIMIY